MRYKNSDSQNEVFGAVGDALVKIRAELHGLYFFPLCTALRHHKVAAIIWYVISTLTLCPT